MSVQIEEFVNPKSMLTPGGATAIVALLAGIIFSATGVQIHILLAFFSLFFGAVVFFSKEFADQAMSKLAKGFFYIVNALIIFAMSTGTHATFAQRPQQPGAQSPATQQGPSSQHPTSVSIHSGGFLISSAHAQTADPALPVVTQERPVFFDWTKEGGTWALPKASPKSPVSVSTVDKSSAFRRALANAGLMTPNVYVGLEIDKSKLPPGAEVKAVHWSLPQTYFETNKKVSIDSTSKFGLGVNAWKSFPVEATVELTSGEKLNYFEFVEIGKAFPEKK